MRMMVKSVMAGVLASLATVAVSGAANAAACIPDTFEHYMALPAAGCTVNDKTFSNFLYGFNGFVNTMANAVGVVPILALDNPGFTFNGNWSIPQSGLTITSGDITFTFDVAAPASHPVTDVSVAFNTVPTAPGQIHESMTVNGTITAFDFFSPPTTTPQIFNFVTPLTNLHVVEDIGLVGPESLSVVTKQFSERVPEPASLAILGVSLLGMGAAAAGRRRFRK